MLVTRRPHPDALVSDPRPIFHSGGLINSPDASVDTRAVRGQVRSAGDFPLAGFVGEAVSDLQVLREDVVGEKSGLPRALVSPLDSGDRRPSVVPRSAWP